MEHLLILLYVLRTNQCQISPLALEHDVWNRVNSVTILFAYCHLDIHHTFIMVFNERLCVTLWYTCITRCLEQCFIGRRVLLVLEILRVQCFVSISVIPCISVLSPHS